MKKLYPILLCTLLLSFSSIAQVQIGIEGGVNVSGIEESFPPGSGSGRLGFNVGLPLNIYIADWLTLQPTLQYSSQGSKESYQYFTTSGNPLFYSIDQVNKLDYVNVPVLALIRLGKSGGYLSGGVSFGFLISASADVKYVGSGVSNPADEVYDIKEFMNESDFSLVFGAGWEFPNGLVLNARFFFGQKEVLKNPDEQVQENYTLPQGKNQVMQLSLGFLFGN